MEGNKNKKNSEEDFPDFICFIDDDESEKKIYVKVLEVGSFVRFRIKSGKIVSIPSHRVKKVKEKGDINE